MRVCKDCGRELHKTDNDDECTECLEEPRAVKAYVKKLKETTVDILSSGKRLSDPLAKNWLALAVGIITRKNPSVKR